MNRNIGFGALIVALGACSSSGGTSSSSSGSSSGAPEDVDSGTVEDAQASVDAKPEASLPSNCSRCNAAGYICNAPGAGGGTIELNATQDPDGTCKLNNGKITLKCGGSGIAANGAPLPWVEGQDGSLQLGTGNSQLQCTPK
jgi:hypothetical protein